MVLCAKVVVATEVTHAKTNAGRRSFFMVFGFLVSAGLPRLYHFRKMRNSSMEAFLVLDGVTK